VLSHAALLNAIPAGLAYIRISLRRHGEFRWVGYELNMGSGKI
jgi:hypothetical protein